MYPLRIPEPAGATAAEAAPSGATCRAGRHHWRRTVGLAGQPTAKTSPGRAVGPVRDLDTAGRRTWLT